MIKRIKGWIGKKSSETAEPLATVEDRETSRRNKIIGVIALAVGVTLLGSVIWSSIGIFKPISKAPSPSAETQKTVVKKGAVQSELVDKDTVERNWKAAWEKKQQDNEKEELEKDKKIAELQQKIVEMEKREQEKEKKEKESKNGNGQSGKTSGGTKIPPGTPPIPSSTRGAYGGQADLSQERPVVYQQQTAPPAPPPPPQPSFKRFEFGGKQAAAKSVEDIYIPMGFTVGVTLNGGDMPTLSWGQQDPQPIAASIETDMITAGDVRLDLRRCMVLASAHGSVSSERAMPRLVKMQCRDKKGNLYSGDVDGYMIGDDGKVGHKGILVSRQGAILTKVFVAKALEGIASIIKSQSTTVSISSLGTTSTINPSDAVQAGVASGFEGGANQLSQFYLKVVEQMYPVVELLPGKKTTIFFKGGSRLARVTKDQVEEVRTAKTDTSAKASPSPTQKQTEKAAARIAKP